MKSLRTKILLSYGLLLSFVVLVGGWGLYSLRRLGVASEAILRENYRSILAADQMIASVERQDSATLLTLLSSPEQGVEQFRHNQILFLQWLGRAKDNITLAGEKKNLEQIEATYKAYLMAFDQLPRTAISASSEDLSIYYESVFPAFEAVLEACRVLKRQNQTAMSQASVTAQSVSQETMISLAIAGVMTAGVGLILSWILANRIIDPLRKLMVATGQVAEGEYDIDLPIQTGDEFEHLAHEFILMTKKLGAFNRLNVGQVIAEKRRNSAILNSMSDGVVAVDDQVEVVTMNPKATEIFNVAESTVLHHPLSAVFKDQELYDSIKKAIHTDDLPHHFELSFPESQQFFNAVITPVHSERDRKLGAIILLQDVTRFKALDQLKSEFVATASHELRTPLTGMMMSINLLMEQTLEKLSDPERELLTSTQENIQRLRALVNDLLDLSKIESGQMILKLAPTSVSELFNTAIASFTLEAQSQNIEIRQRSLDKIPKVNVDQGRIALVLTNLIANALRYTEPHGQITLSAIHKNDWVEISVMDHGAGIPAEYQSRLFDKFVQVETDKDVGGSGLGLAICQKIIQAHGGEIWVNSKVGRGSTFTFSLPAHSMT